MGKQHLREKYLNVFKCDLSGDNRYGSILQLQSANLGGVQHPILKKKGKRNLKFGEICKGGGMETSMAMHCSLCPSPALRNGGGSCVSQSDLPT